MTVLTLEGFVNENGQIQLINHVKLPQQTKVYVVVPDIQAEVVIKEQAHIYSPRLVNHQDIQDFQLEVIEEGADASL